MFNDSPPPIASGLSVKMSAANTATTANVAGILPQGSAAPKASQHVDVVTHELETTGKSWTNGLITPTTVTAPILPETRSLDLKRNQTEQGTSAQTNMRLFASPEGVVSPQPPSAARPVLKLKFEPQYGVQVTNHPSSSSEAEGGPSDLLPSAGMKRPREAGSSGVGAGTMQAVVQGTCTATGTAIVGGAAGGVQQGSKCPRCPSATVQADAEHLAAAHAFAVQSKADEALHKQTREAALAAQDEVAYQTANEHVWKATCRRVAAEEHAALLKDVADKLSTLEGLVQAEERTRQLVKSKEQEAAAAAQQGQRAEETSKLKAQYLKGTKSVLFELQQKCERAEEEASFSYVDFGDAESWIREFYERFPRARQEHAHSPATTDIDRVSMCIQWLTSEQAAKRAAVDARLAQLRASEWSTLATGMADKLQAEDVAKNALHRAKTVLAHLSPLQQRENAANDVARASAAAEAADHALEQAGRQYEKITEALNELRVQLQLQEGQVASLRNKVNTLCAKLGSFIATGRGAAALVDDASTDGEEDVVHAQHVSKRARIDSGGSEGTGSTIAAQAAAGAGSYEPGNARTDTPSPTLAAQLKAAAAMAVGAYTHAEARFRAGDLVIYDPSKKYTLEPITVFEVVAVTDSAKQGQLYNLGKCHVKGAGHGDDVPTLGVSVPEGKISPVDEWVAKQLNETAKLVEALKFNEGDDEQTKSLKRRIVAMSGQDRGGIKVKRGEHVMFCLPSGAKLSDELHAAAVDGWLLGYVAHVKPIGVGYSFSGDAQPSSRSISSSAYTGYRVEPMHGRSRAVLVDNQHVRTMEEYGAMLRAGPHVEAIGAGTGTGAAQLPQYHVLVRRGDGMLVTLKITAATTGKELKRMVRVEIAAAAAPVATMKVRQKQEGNVWGVPPDSFLLQRQAGAAGPVPVADEDVGFMPGTVFHVCAAV